MANTVFKLRRSSVAGKVPNTSTLSIGELAINLTDKILYSSDGSNVFEIGSNLSNISVSSNASINNLIVDSVYANGSLGVSGQVLSSNGSQVFWATAGTGTVNEINTANGLVGGPITTNGTIYVLANNGIVSNTSGLFVNASYIATLNANNATTVGGNTSSDLRSYSESTASNAYSNAVSYVDGKIATANAAITSNAATAYSNAVSYVDGKIATANAAITSNAATAYSNAIAFASNASNINTGTLAEARLPYRMDQNVRTNDTVTFGNITVSGNLTVNGTTITLQGNTVSFTDNMLYLNQGISANITNISGNGTYVTFTANNNYSTGWDVTITGVNPSSYNGNYNNIFLANATHFVVANTNTASYVSGGVARGKTDSNPDLGFAAGYNDGTYQHAGFFRDASDGIWKVFDGYLPEPDQSVFIDTTNTSFKVANFQANTYFAGNTSTNWFVANGSGAYHTGTVNAASHTVGTSFTANSTMTNTVSLVVSTNTATIGTGTYFVANGNVGIGTSTPGYKLEVNGETRILNNRFASGSIEVNGLGTGNRYALIDFIGDDTYTDYGLRIIRDNVGANSGSEISHRGTGQLGLKTIEAAPITFYTNNAERMRIASDGTISVGTTTTGSVSMLFGGNAPAVAAARTLQAAQLISSSTTTNFINIASYPSVANAVFTLPNLYHFLAGQATYGASATITSQSGFYVASSLTGATNNYGFRSDIPSGTGRWNVYSGGTADNFFAGNVGIGTNSPSNLLDVAGMIRMNSATQFNGLTMQNGTYEFAKLYGQSATNDNGVLSLNLAGTPNVILRASGINYINGGNVGIGVSSPSQKLDVAGIITNRGAASVGWVNISQGDTRTGFTDYMYANSQSVGFVGYGDSTTMLAWARDGKNLSLGANSTTVMLLSSNGNVGVANGIPSHKLSVSGTGYFADTVSTAGSFSVGTTDFTTDLAYNTKLVVSGTGPVLYLRETDGDDWALSALSNNFTIRSVPDVANSSTWTAPFFVGTGAPTNSLYVAANGNVGCGTASPSTKLHLSGTDATLRIDGTGSSVSSIQLNPTATAGYLGTISNYPLIFVTASGGTEKMRIDTGGNVAIGTTTTNSRLVVSAADGVPAYFAGATKAVRIVTGTGGCSVEGVDNTGYASYQPLTVGGSTLTFHTGGTGRLSIDASGNVLPGADNTYNLGSLTMRWANIYTGDLHLSNENSKGNDVDKTTGNWTIQEGENDLYIINNKNGKRFKFKLEEIQ
jgi:hypothetical protein